MCYILYKFLVELYNNEIHIENEFQMQHSHDPIQFERSQFLLKNHF